MALTCDFTLRRHRPWWDRNISALSPGWIESAIVIVPGGIATVQQPPNVVGVDGRNCPWRDRNRIRLVSVGRGGLADLAIARAHGLRFRVDGDVGTTIRAGDRSSARARSCPGASREICFHRFFGHG